jgi:heme-degrading monooxygenase HmoA
VIAFPENFVAAWWERQHDRRHLRSLTKARAQEGISDIAAQLRPILEKIDGFISIEPFESLTEPGKILSLSFFRDEAAVQAAQRTNTLSATGRRGRLRLRYA